jgi:hypothetical protein
MSIPDDPGSAPSNIVLFPASPSSSGMLADCALRAHDALRVLCIESAALRVEWLTAGVACWPDSLITREHMLTQLHALAESIRGMKELPRPSPTAPRTGGAA